MIRISAAMVLIVGAGVVHGAWTNRMSTANPEIYELCYVERMSLWLDVRVMVGTVLKCLGVPFIWSK